MDLKHFTNTNEVIKYAFDEWLCELREEHAIRMGSRADEFTDEEFYELEDKIDDLEAVGRDMGLKV